MSKRRRWMLMGLVIVIVAAPLGGGLAAQEDGGQQVTVSGTLVGIDENADGNYTRVFLRADLPGNILVADDEKGAELVEHAGDAVEITGLLVDAMEGDYDMVIHVESWSLIAVNQPGTIDPD